MYDATLLDTVGRLLLVSLFVVTGIMNLAPATVKEHVHRMTDLGVPFPAVSLWFGTAIEFAGCALVLTGWHADIGVILLIVFIVVATWIFHRFWIYSDPLRRRISRLTLLSNTAIVGGLLLLLQNVRA